MRIPISILIGVGALSLAAGAANAQPYLGSDFGYDPACWSDGWNSVYDMPYCGWYNGFFYPGAGNYVFDRHHHRYDWGGEQQNHWSQRIQSGGFGGMGGRGFGGSGHDMGGFGGSHGGGFGGGHDGGFGGGGFGGGHGGGFGGGGFGGGHGGGGGGHGH